MPANASLLMATPGQTLAIALAQNQVGNAPDLSAIVSISGIFGGVMLGIEGIPIGQPLLQPPLGTGGPNPVPASLSEWVPLQEIGVVDGVPISSPIGPFASIGGVGTGFAWAFGCAQFSQLQLRLISIGSGAIQAGIASTPFLVPGPLSSGNAPLMLELARIRKGFELFLEVDLKEAIPNLTNT